MSEKENENKVSIKLERYRWPDELDKQRKKRRIILLVVGGILFSFFLGWQTNGLFKTTTTPTAQVSQEMASFQRVYNDILSNWFFISEMDDPETELMNNAIKGMLELNGDVHTSYLTQEEVLTLTQSINMDFEGIGVGYLNTGDISMVTRVYKDSPAEQAGVEVGDVISKVDGESVAGVDSDTLQSMIKGEGGTDVTIEFLRGQEAVTLVITRDTINALTWGRMIDEKIAYLEISSFGMDLGSSTQAYFDDFLSQGATDLIIDLRDNGGGYLDAVEQIGTLLFDNNDVIYQEVFADGSNQVYNVTGSKSATYNFDNIVVLVNENSASASEVLTLALKENLGATVVGTTSFGKGTVQTTHQYGDNTALKLTIAKWSAPSGLNIDGIGITPDVEVSLPDIFYTSNVELAEGESIAYDSVHAGVAYVQKALSYLGYYSGRTDGYYDTATQTALLQFKQTVGLDNGDSIDQETLTQAYRAVVMDWTQNRDARDVQLLQAIEELRSGS